MRRRNGNLLAVLAGVYGFVGGVAAAALSSAAGLCLWMLGIAAAATFAIGGRLVREADLAPLVRRTAEYDAALEKARAELQEVEQ
jgi:hypothetical protein